MKTVYQRQWGHTLVGPGPSKEQPPDGFRVDGPWEWLAYNPKDCSTSLFRRPLSRLSPKVGKMTKATHPKWAQGHGVPAGQVLDMVLDCIEQITGREANPKRSGTAAKPLLSLWRALEKPPAHEFRDEVRLVAKAARECDDPLFARDIRGEGWEGGRDRSRDVTTLCVQRRWHDRLNAARDWQRSRTPDPQPTGPATPPPSGLFDRRRDR